MEKEFEAYAVKLKTFLESKANKITYSNVELFRYKVASWQKDLLLRTTYTQDDIDQYHKQCLEAYGVMDSSDLLKLEVKEVQATSRRRANEYNQVFNSPDWTKAVIDNNKEIFLKPQRPVITKWQIKQESFLKSRSANKAKRVRGMSDENFNTKEGVKVVITSLQTQMEELKSFIADSLALAESNEAENKEALNEDIESAFDELDMLTLEMKSLLKIQSNTSSTSKLSMKKGAGQKGVTMKKRNKTFLKETLDENFKNKEATVQDDSDRGTTAELEIAFGNQDSRGTTAELNDAFDKNRGRKASALEMESMLQEMEISDETKSAMDLTSMLSELDVNESGNNSAIELEAMIKDMNSAQAVTNELSTVLDTIEDEEEDEMDKKRKEKKEARKRNGNAPPPPINQKKKGKPPPINKEEIPKKIKKGKAGSGPPPPPPPSAPPLVVDEESVVVASNANEEGDEDEMDKKRREKKEKLKSQGTKLLPKTAPSPPPSAPQPPSSTLLTGVENGDEDDEEDEMDRKRREKKERLKKQQQGVPTPPGSLPPSRGGQTPPAPPGSLPPSRGGPTPPSRAGSKRGTPLPPNAPPPPPRPPSFPEDKDEEKVLLNGTITNQNIPKPPPSLEKKSATEDGAKDDSQETSLDAASTKNSKTTEEVNGESQDETLTKEDSETKKTGKKRTLDAYKKVSAKDVKSKENENEQPKNEAKAKESKETKKESKKRTLDAYKSASSKAKDGEVPSFQPDENRRVVKKRTLQDYDDEELNKEIENNIADNVAIDNATKVEEITTEDEISQILEPKVLKSKKKEVENVNKVEDNSNNGGDTTKQEEENDDLNMSSGFIKSDGIYLKPDLGIGNQQQSKSQHRRRKPRIRKAGEGDVVPLPPPTPPPPPMDSTTFDQSSKTPPGQRKPPPPSTPPFRRSMNGQPPPPATPPPPGIKKDGVQENASLNESRQIKLTIQTLPDDEDINNQTTITSVQEVQKDGEDSLESFGVKLSENGVDGIPTYRAMAMLAAGYKVTSNDSSIQAWTVNTTTNANANNNKNAIAQSLNTMKFSPIKKVKKSSSEGQLINMSKASFALRDKRNNSLNTNEALLKKKIRDRNKFSQSSFKDLAYFVNDPLEKVKPVSSDSLFDLDAQLSEKSFLNSDGVQIFSKWEKRAFVKLPLL